jgi:serine/threonine protein kinase
MTKIPRDEPLTLHHRDEISFTPPELRGNRAPGLSMYLSLLRRTVSQLHSAAWYFWYNQIWTSAGREAAIRPRKGYHILDTLGEGAYGKVHRAIENATGRVVALKTVNKTRQLKSHRRNEQGLLETVDPYKDIVKEFEMFRGIRHPNLIEYLGTTATDIGTGESPHFKPHFGR